MVTDYAVRIVTDKYPKVVYFGNEFRLLQVGEREYRIERCGLGSFPGELNWFWVGDVKRFAVASDVAGGLLEMLLEATAPTLRVMTGRIGKIGNLAPDGLPWDNGGPAHQ